MARSLVQALFIMISLGRASASSCRIAVLLVHGRGSFRPATVDFGNVTAIMDHLAADVFVVTDELGPEFNGSAHNQQALCPESLRTTAGNVRAFGAIRARPPGDMAAHERELAQIQLNDSLLPGMPHRPPSLMCGVERTSNDTRRICQLSHSYTDKSAQVSYQYYKNRLAWRLLTLAEAEDAATYDVVVKMRLDVTPLAAASFWDRDAMCAAARARPASALYMLSDFFFWGGRAAAEVANRAWEGIAELFAVSKASERPFSVDALLESLLASPEEAFTKQKKRLYNKLSSIPFPRVHGRPDRSIGSRALIIHNVKATQNSGFNYLDPRRRRRGQPPIDFPKLNYRNKDDIDFCFCSCEKELLVWILAHNISVFDLGAAVTTVFFKGAIIAR